MTDYSQICTQHIMETAHSGSHARIRTPLQEKVPDGVVVEEQ